MPTSPMIPSGPTVHLVELDGRGGPYQHAVAVAHALHAAGGQVVLHTATDPELMPRTSIEVCRCMDWRRDGGRGRRALVGARFLMSTAPHLVRVRGVLHLQGPFKAALLAAVLTGRRVARRPTVFSPHNTFARSGSAMSERWIRLGTRLADATIVFSNADARVVESWRGVPVVSPLLQLVPVVGSGAVHRWRDRWGDGPVVLFAGQVRRDKRLDLLVEAAARWTSPARLAVVGADEEAAAPFERQAADLGVDVDWSFGFADLADLVSAISAATVVVCPYGRASQSGILALADELGVPSVACDVGGLAELATVSVPRDASPDQLAYAVDRVVASAPSVGRRISAAATVAAHQHAYGIALPISTTA